MTKIKSNDKEEIAEENFISAQTMGLPATRLECLKLAHSASKSVEEILNDAAVYTNWVWTGEKQETESP